MFTEVVHFRLREVTLRGVQCNVAVCKCPSHALFFALATRSVDAFLPQVSDFDSTDGARDPRTMQPQTLATASDNTVAIEWRPSKPPSSYTPSLLDSLTTAAHHREVPSHYAFAGFDFARTSRKAAAPILRIRLAGGAGEATCDEESPLLKGL